MASHGTVRIGISGWRYKGWRDAFYPRELAQKRELAYAANIFSTIEINGTFYSLQRPESFAHWASQTPDDFVFAVKGSRYLTHVLRLREVTRPLANFFGSGLLRLGHKLGPILWQFPPNFRFDFRRMESFFKLLPRDFVGAAQLARRHDKWISGRSWMRVRENYMIRHAVEVRNNSFLSLDFVHLLRVYRIALVCADAVEWARRNGCDLRFRVFPPAWLRTALRERIRRQGPRPVGFTGCRLGTRPRTPRLGTDRSRSWPQDVPSRRVRIFR